MNRDYVVRYARSWCGRLGITVPPLAIRNMNTMGSISYHKGCLNGYVLEDRIIIREPRVSINRLLLMWWMRDELEDTIRHELIHIASDDYGHGVVFKACARRYNVKIRQEDT